MTQPNFCAPVCLTTGCFYLGKQSTLAILEEWTDLLQVAAVADVLEVRAVFHAGQVRALPFADQGWAAFLGKLVSRFGVEGAEAVRLEIFIRPNYNLQVH